jgi:hypothetical protein
MFIEAEHKLDRLEFFKEVHENEMSLGNRLIIAVICKVDERFVETEH